MKPLVGLDPVAFRRRWAAVNDVTRREAAALSAQQRLEELDALNDFLRSIEPRPARGRLSGETRVRLRWNRLRRALRGIA